MIDEVMMQLALRTRALTLSVASTGAVSLSATATGYARTTGSFQTDGFWPGMEILPAGFATNLPRVVTAVTPLAITVDTTVTPMTAEGATGGRALTVGLPSSRAWENIAFEPTAGVPWVREEFLPGPSSQVTIGPTGELVVEPQYVLSVNVPSASGLTVKRYVNALRLLFAPRTAITLANGDVLRVRSDTSISAGQLLQGEPGFAVQPFTIPLRLRTQNSI
jgi:hypothetical protein